MFVVLWCNLGVEVCDFGFDDYLCDGCMVVFDVVWMICGEVVYVVGYCLGGMLFVIVVVVLVCDGW